MKMDKCNNACTVFSFSNNRYGNAASAYPSYFPVSLHIAEGK